MINNEVKDTLGTRLHFLMVEHGDSKKGLSKALGVSCSNLNYYLSDRHLPSANNLKKIAERYQVEVDWLLCMPDVKPRSRDLETAYKVDRTIAYSKEIIKNIQHETKRILLALELVTEKEGEQP